MRHLYLKSGALQRYRDFAAHVRGLALRQTLPGYRLFIERNGRTEWLAFRGCPIGTPRGDLSTASVEEPVDEVGMDSVDQRHATR
jgi:hypothetical protein